MNLVKQLQPKGWIPRPALLRGQATELLIKKGDNRKLGVKWISSFLDRHQDLIPIFRKSVEKQRSAVQGIPIPIGWCFHARKTGTLVNPTDGRGDLAGPISGQIQTL